MDDKQLNEIEARAELAFREEPCPLAEEQEAQLNSAADVPALLAEVGRLRALLEETRTRQAVRLKAAEDTCVMLGWSAARHEGDREKATHELWSRWVDIVGSDFLAREAHPDLSRKEIVRLAAQRDETRARTLAKIRGEAL